MIKRTISGFLVAVMALSIVGCSGGSGSGSENETASTKKKTTIEKPSNIDTSWYTDDDSVIYSGAYVVGEDIAEGNYVLTVLKDDINYGFTYVHIFESVDSYTAYNKAPKETDEEWDAAKNEYIVYGGTDTFHEGESCSLNLSEGNVLVVHGGVNTMKLDPNTEPVETDIQTSTILYQGVHDSGNISNGTYMLTCYDDHLSIYIFDSKDEYNAFMDAKSEDYSKAMAEHVYWNYRLYEDQGCCINMDSDNVILIKDGNGYMEKVSPSWSVK